MTPNLRVQTPDAFAKESDQEGGLQLGRVFSALQRNIFLIIGVTTLTATAAVLKAVTETPVYSSGFELLTPPETLEAQILSTLPESVGRQSDDLRATIDDAQLRILTSPRVMEPILEEIRFSYPETTYGELVGNLAIEPGARGGGNTRTLKVAFQNPDSQKVSDVLDILAASFVQYSLENRQSGVFRGMDFVDDQLPSLRSHVENLERGLERLRQENNLIDPIAQGQQVANQISNFDDEQLNLRVQLKLTQDLYQMLQEELSGNKELASSSAILANPRYQNLLNQLLEVDSQLAQELTLYLDNSPEIEILQEQRQNLQPLLAQESVRVQRQVAAELQELSIRDQALSETIEGLNQEIKQISTVARQYAGLQRELDIAADNLNQFLTKRETLRIDAAQQRAPWEILTPPGQPSVSSTSAKNNLLLGTLLGLLLGSGAAIIVDRLRGKIYTAEELKSATRLPVLTTIPFDPFFEAGNSVASMLGRVNGIIPDIQGILPLRSPQELASTPFFEAFRLLYTSIQLSNPDRVIHSLTVSSAMPNAGKSTVSLHLGLAAACMGKKVLIVDTDLRRPSLHKLATVANHQGLTNYVAGEVDIESIVVNIPLDKNLFLIPAGTIPPDPARIISSDRMATLIEKIHGQYDFIIFDTPPLLGFSDPYLVANQTQGLLMVVNLGETKYVHLEKTLDELSIASTNTIGLVANRSKEKSESFYSYYQDHQYSASLQS